MRALGAAAVIAVLYAALAFWPGPGAAGHPYYDGVARDHFETIAHAGGLGLAPANTLTALAMARDHGADVLEIDLQLTADGRLVLMHDDTLDRTTNLSGRVDAFTLDEIRAADAAWGYEGDDPDAFAGQGVYAPSVDEALATFPGARWIMELKNVGPQAAEELCRAIREAGAETLVMAASFHDGTLRAFRAACPEVATSMGADETRWFYYLARAGLANLHPTPAVAMQIPERHGDLTVAHPRLIAAARARGIRVQIWTVNDPADMARLIDLGVDGIITDRIDRLNTVLGREGGG